MDPTYGIPNIGDCFPANLMDYLAIFSKNYSRFFCCMFRRRTTFPFLSFRNRQERKGSKGLDDKPDKRNGERIHLPKAKLHKHPTATHYPVNELFDSHGQQARGCWCFGLFSGSPGPTAVAAKRLGRRFIGIGLDSGCFGAAHERPRRVKASHCGWRA